MARIHISEPIDPQAVTMLSAYGEVDIAEPFTPLAELYERIKDAEIVINLTDTTPVDKAFIDAAPKLRHIARHASGYDNVDVAYATEKGILVTNAAGGNARTMAEFTMGLMLAVVRKVLPSVDASRQGRPDRTHYRGFELHGKTLGLVGTGYVGRAVARLAAAFGMTIIGYDAYASDEDMAAAGIKRVDSLEALLAGSTVVSLHVPLTDATWHMIGARELAFMQPGSILMNMARGGVLDEAALIEAVRSGHLAGAALDVVENEPIAPDNPLLHVDNILAVPHIGGQTGEAFSNNSMIVARDVLAYARGERPDHIINPQVLTQGNAD